MKTYLILLAILFHSFLALSQDFVTIDRYAHSTEMGSINEILIDKANRKWIASDQGVFVLSQFEQASKKVSNQLNAVCLADNDRGEVWAAFSNGDLINMETSVKIKMDVEGAQIRDMKLIKSKLWVATNKGLYLYNTKNQKLAKDFRENNSKLKSSVINFVHQDVYDVVWVGTKKRSSSLYR